MGDAGVSGGDKDVDKKRDATGPVTTTPSVKPIASLKTDEDAALHTSSETKLNLPDDTKMLLVGLLGFDPFEAPKKKAADKNDVGEPSANGDKTKKDEKQIEGKIEKCAPSEDVLKRAQETSAVKFSSNALNTETGATLIRERIKEQLGQDLKLGLIKALDLEKPPAIGPVLVAIGAITPAELKEARQLREKRAAELEPGQKEPTLIDVLKEVNPAKSEQIEKGKKFYEAIWAELLKVQKGDQPAGPPASPPDQGSKIAPKDKAVLDPNDPKVMPIKDVLDPKDTKKDVPDLARTDAPKPEHLQEFLLKRMDSIDAVDARAKLMEITKSNLEESYKTLPDNEKKTLEPYFKNPEQLNKLVFAGIREQSIKALDEQVQAQKISPEEANKLKQALNKGELPKEVIKLLLESEKAKGQFGPVTKAVYGSLLDGLQTDTRANVAAALFNGKEFPKDSPLPFQVDEKGRAKLDPATSDGVLKGDVDYLKVTSTTVPKDEQLQSLEKLETFNKSLKADRDPELDKFQTMLESRVSKLDGQDLYRDMKRETEATLRRLYQEDKLPEEITKQLKAAEDKGKTNFNQEIGKLADKNLQEMIEASLTRQVKEGKLTSTEKAKEIEAAKNGIISRSTVSDLLKQELNATINGIMTRAVARSTEIYYNKRLSSAEQRLERDKAPRPEGNPVEAKKKLSLALESGKPLSAGTIADSPDKLEQLEKWLKKVEGDRNPQLERLHDMLTGLSGAIPTSMVAEELKKGLLPQVDEKFRKRQLAPEDIEALSNLDGDELNAKKLEIAGKILQDVLQQELEDRSRAGLIPTDAQEKLKQAIDKGEVPDVLLMSMLEKERLENTFGPVTKAFYAASLDTVETEIPSNFVSLGRSGLQIPDDCPIKVEFTEEGKPKFDKEMVQGYLALMADGKTPRHPLPGLDASRIPTDDDLKTLIKAAKWNHDASKEIVDNYQNHQAKMLKETVVKIDRPEWLPKPGDDRDTWMARVGPMVDLTMKVKATAQALKLAERMKTGEINFKSTALTTDFPGPKDAIKFDSDGNITGIKIDIPSDLTTSFENAQKLKRINDWLAENEGPAKQCMDELAKAAQDDSRILIWADIPHQGTFTDPEGKTHPYNLEKNRIKIEEVEVDGKKKIRVRNYVDYHQSELYNFWDLGAEKVGTKEVKCLAANKDIEKALKDAAVDDKKIPALIEKIKECKNAEETSRLLEKAGVKNTDDVAKNMWVDYRDYDPGDMVAMYKDGQVAMLMAKNVEAWRSNEEFNQDVGKGTTIAMDVGMLALGVFGGWQAFAMKTAVKEGASLAFREAVSLAFKQALKSSAKSIVLGGSGFVLNNAKVQSTDWGKKVHFARNVVFVLDGVHSIGAFGKGMLTKGGLLKVPAMTQEAQNAARVQTLMENWSSTSNVLKNPLSMRTPVWLTHGAMFGAEMSMGRQLLKDAPKAFGFDQKASPALKYGEQLLAKIKGDGNDAVRFLRTTGDALAGKDPALKGKLGAISDKILDGQKLSGEERTKKAKELLDTYEKVRNDKKTSDQEKAMLAIGVLMLNQKEDGKLPDVLGPRYIQYGHKGEIRYDKVDIKTSELVSKIGDTVLNGTPEAKMAAGQALVAFGKMDMPQYANLCRCLLADEKAGPDVKVQALMGLTTCIDVAKGEESRPPSGEKRAAYLFESFGCSSDQLMANIKEVATKDGDKEVRAMAATILNALQHEDNSESQRLVDNAFGTWQAMKLTRQVNDLEATLKNGADGKDKLDDKAKEAINKDLTAKKTQLQAALQAVALMNNPGLLPELASISQTAESERDAQALKTLTSQVEAVKAEAKLKAAPSDSPDLKNLEQSANEAREKAKEEKEKLADLQKKSENPTLDPKKVPPAPASFSDMITQKWLKELEVPPPDGDDKQRNWATRKLLALDSLAMLKPDNDVQKKIDAGLFDLIKLENGPIAVEALSRLMPDKIKSLSQEQKDWIKEEIPRILGAPHTIDRGSTGEVERGNAEAKVKLLDLSKALVIDSGIYGIPDQIKFAKAAASLIDRSDRRNFAENYADLRLATVKALGSLSDVIKQMPDADREKIVGTRPERLGVLPSCMLPEVGLQGDDAKLAPKGESGAAVRKEAFAVLKKLGDPSLMDFALKCAASERDPELATIYANMEFQSLRPDRPDCALRIYDYEVRYWNDILAGAQSRFSNDQSKNYIEHTFSFINPETKHFLLTMEAMGPIGLEGETRDKKIAENRENTKKEIAKEWEQLTTGAGKAGRDGDKDKAALMWVATLNSDWEDQLKAAQLIHKLVKDGIPDKELFYPGIIEAFRNDNTPRRHEVRKEFIAMLDELLGDPNDPKNPPKISKMYAGRIIQEALQIEFSPTRNGSDFLTNKQKIETQVALIKLLDKCDYPLALAQIRALSSGKTVVGSKEEVIKVAPEVQKAAQAFYDRLQKTAPKTPGDLDVSVDKLQKATTARTNTLKLLKKGAESGTSDEAGATIDSIATRKTIVDCCMYQPIDTLGDRRIPLLQSFLHDDDKGVALTAAWFLVNSVNPLNTVDKNTRQGLRDQPYFKQAQAKLEELANQTDAKGPDADTKKDAERFLSIMKTWDRGEKFASLPVPDDKKVLTGEDKMFADLKPILNGAKRDATIEEKKNAIEIVVRLAAHNYFDGKPEKQADAYDLLRQVASTKDKVLAKAAYNAIEAVRQEPVSDVIDGKGGRVSTWANGGKTTVSEGLDARKVEYPDGSWLQFNLTKNGQVTSYRSSENPTAIKKAGVDFQLGEVSVNKDGTAWFDSRDGARTVRQLTGDSWVFQRGPTDPQVCLAALQTVLNDASVPNTVKAKAVLESINGYGFESAPIQGKDDPRLTLIRDLMKADGKATGDQKPGDQAEDEKSKNALRFAAARTLIDPRNSGVDEATLKEAKQVFIDEELKKSFNKDLPTQELLHQMHDSMELLGPVATIDDARLSMFVDALKSKDANVRLEAARIIADGNNAGFSKEQRVDAVKVAYEYSKQVLKDSENSKLDWKEQQALKETNARLRVGALDVIRSGAKALGDYDMKLDDGKGLKFHAGELAKVTFTNGDTIDCGWDAVGLNKFKVVAGKETLEGDFQSSEMGYDKKANERLSSLDWLNASTAKDALYQAMSHGDHRIALVAASALVKSSDGSDKQEAVGRIAGIATNSTTNTAGSSAQGILTNLIKNGPLDDQLLARVGWQKAYDYNRGGPAPTAIPESTLSKYDKYFTNRSAFEWDKVNVLYNGTSWLHDNASDKLTGNDFQDAGKISYLLRDGTNNSRYACEAIFASLKNNPIKDENDPRRRVLLEAVKDYSGGFYSPNDRVALTSAWMLANSKVPGDLQTATIALAELGIDPRHNVATRAEAKALLTDMITFGSDEQQKIALDAWKKVYDRQTTKLDADKPPTPTEADQARRYLHYASQKELERLYAKPLDERKAILLKVQNTDDPKHKWTESDLESMIQAPSWTPVVDRSNQLFGNRSFPFYADQSDPFRRLANPFERYRPDTPFEALMRKTGGALDVWDADNPGKSYKTVKLIPDADRRLKPATGRLLLAGDIQRQLNAFGSGAEVEVDGEGKIALKLNQLKLGGAGKDPLKIGGKGDEDTVKFFQSASPELLAQFSKDLFKYNPELASQKGIDANELAVMFKNWLTQKASGRQHLIFSSTYHDSAVDGLALTYDQPFGRESEMDAGKFTRNWRDLAKKRETLREEAVNSELKKRLNLPEPTDKLPHWKPDGKPEIKRPDVLTYPPLTTMLDRYKTNVVNLLPSDALKKMDGGTQIPVSYLKWLADQNPDKDVVVTPDLGKGTRFKLDPESQRILRTIRYQKVQDGIRLLNVDKDKN